MEDFAIATRTAPANKTVFIVDLTGSLDINTVGDFETVLNNFFKNRQYQIVLNFAKLNYISSAGVGLLVGNLKQVRKNRGDIKIADLKSDVYKVFDLLELTGLFHILKTETEAVAEFSGGNADRVSFV